MYNVQCTKYKVKCIINILDRSKEKFRLLFFLFSINENYDCKNLSFGIISVGAAEKDDCA